MNLSSFHIVDVTVMVTEGLLGLDGNTNVRMKSIEKDEELREFASKTHATLQTLFSQQSVIGLRSRHGVLNIDSCDQVAKAKSHVQGCETEQDGPQPAVRLRDARTP